MRKQKIHTEIPSPSHSGSNEAIPCVCGAKASCLSKPAPPRVLPCTCGSHPGSLLKDVPPDISLSPHALQFLPIPWTIPQSIQMHHHFCSSQNRPNQNQNFPLTTPSPICLLHFMAKLGRAISGCWLTVHTHSLLQSPHSPTGEDTLVRSL